MTGELRDVHQKARCVLTVDVGNTKTRFGLFNDGVFTSLWEITTSDGMTADEARLALAGFFSMTDSGDDRDMAAKGGIRPSDAILACVVPGLVEPWTSALRYACGRRPLVVGPGLKTGIKMNYKDPSEVGPDRVADLVAAKAAYGHPLIIVDLGTTTNFEVVDSEGAFAGGVIAAGLQLAARSLAAAAARLPVIEVQAPPAIIGKTTREAMQAGVVMGEVARIDGIIDMIWNELGHETRIVITGTNASELAALLSHETTPDDTLTLRGLSLLHEMNRRK